MFFCSTKLGFAVAEFVAPGSISAPSVAISSTISTAKNDHK